MKLVDKMLMDKKFVVGSMFLKACKSLNVSLEEFYLLVFFENSTSKTFNPDIISMQVGIGKEEVLKSFSTLLSKNIISVLPEKDLDGRVEEIISLDGVYQIIKDLLENDNQKEKTSNIYNSFETEFGRTISPMEYEIINAWLDNGMSEELIEGALKEAIYNGVKSLRYIDKILFTWRDKGFKTMEDVNKHLKTRKKEEQKELFDYNWLEDNEQ